MPRMIALLLCLLTSSCAALQPPPPLSADTRILLNTSDASSVPSCNRPALEVMTLRRESDKRGVSLALSDAWEAADVCAQREHELEAENERNAWWQRYGPILLVTGLAAGAVIGGFAGAALERVRWIECPEWLPLSACWLTDADRRPGRLICSLLRQNCSSY